MPFTEESIDLAQALVLLKETPAAIVRLMTPLPDVLLDATDGPDTWSPRVILQHLIWAEVDDWIPRVRLILEQQDRVAFTPFDRDGGRRYDGWPIARLGDEFLRLRAENLVILDSLRLGPAELQLPGRHPTLGGVTLSQIHEIDFLIALLGRPERVFSLGGKLSSLEVDVDDVSSSLLEFRGSEGRVLPVRLHQDFVQRPGERRFVLVGDAGKLEWSLSGRSLRRWSATGELCETHDYTDLPRNRLFEDELSHFLGCVERAETPNVSLASGAESLAVALAILESQASGMPVNVGAVLDRAGLQPGDAL